MKKKKKINKKTQVSKRTQTDDGTTDKGAAEVAAC